MKEIPYYVLELPHVSGNPNYLGRVRLLARSYGQVGTVLVCSNGNISIVKLKELKRVQKWGYPIYSHLAEALKAYEKERSDKKNAKRVVVASPRVIGKLVEYIKHYPLLTLNGEVSRLKVMTHYQARENDTFIENC